MAKVSIVILAAGHGSRLKQPIPKPLIPILGKPCVQWLLDMIKKVGIDDVVMVISPEQKAIFENQLRDYDCSWAYQTEAQGTAHAAKMGLKKVKHEHVIIVNGDVPCVPAKTILALLVKPMALVGFQPESLAGYGIIKHKNNVAELIDESNSLSLGLANAGIYKMPTDWCLNNIDKIVKKGSKNEYWITELVELAYLQEKPFEVLVTGELWQYSGVNIVAQWMVLEKVLHKQITAEMILKGVYLQDASSICWSPDMDVAAGVRIGKGCCFEGKVTIASGVVIEPYCIIKSSRISKNVCIRSHTTLSNSHIGEHSIIGPYAYLCDSQCGGNVEIGNFVEVKRSNLGSYSKAKHLAYIGDVVSGMGINVGAGVIVCNYDGREKHKTQIGHGAFIGSNSILIAPIVVGNYAVIGAGSVVSKQVPEAMLMLTRAESRTRSHSLCQILQNKWADKIKNYTFNDEYKTDIDN